MYVLFPLIIIHSYPRSLQSQTRGRRGGGVFGLLALVFHSDRDPLPNAPLHTSVKQFSKPLYT